MSDNTINLDDVGNYWDIDNGIFQVKGKNDSSYALRITSNNEISINGALISDGTLEIKNLGNQTDIVNNDPNYGNFTRITGEYIQTCKLESPNGKNYWNLNTGEFCISDGNKKVIYNDVSGFHIDASYITVGELNPNIIGDGITLDKVTGISSISGDNRDNWVLNLANGSITIGDIDASQIKGTQKISTNRIDATDVVSKQAYASGVNSVGLTAVVQLESSEISADQIDSGTVIVNGAKTGWKLAEESEEESTHEEATYALATDGVESEQAISDGEEDEEDIEEPDDIEPEVKEWTWETDTTPIAKKGGLLILDDNNNIIGKWDSDGIYATKGSFASGGYGSGTLFYTKDNQDGTYLEFNSSIKLHYKTANDQYAETDLIYTDNYWGDLCIGSPNGDIYIMANTYLGCYDKNDIGDDNDLYGIDDIGVYCKKTGTSDATRTLKYDETGERHSGKTDEVMIEVDKDGNITTDTRLHFVNGILVEIGYLPK